MDIEIFKILTQYAQHAGYFEGVLIAIRIQKLSKSEIDYLIDEALRLRGGSDEVPATDNDPASSTSTKSDVARN